MLKKYFNCNYWTVLLYDKHKSISDYGVLYVERHYKTKAFHYIYNRFI